MDKYIELLGTPDYEDILPKTIYYTKTAAAGGFWFSTLEVLIRSKPKTVGGVFARYWYFTLPFAGAGVMFGAVTGITAQIRKKDGALNHIAGSMAAGSVWAAKYNGTKIAWPIAFLLAVVTGCYKFLKVNNLPIRKFAARDERMHYPRYDFSIKYVKDPGRPTNVTFSQ